MTTNNLVTTLSHQIAETQKMIMLQSQNMQEHFARAYPLYHGGKENGHYPNGTLTPFPSADINPNLGGNQNACGQGAPLGFVSNNL